MITRPMLADRIVNINKIEFPVIASPKLDGIRCLKVSGKAVTRNFKPIPNDYIRSIIEKYYPDGIDGEILVEGAAFNDIQSAVMCEDGEPDFTFHAFDLVLEELSEPFFKRIYKLKKLDLPHLEIVKQQVIECQNDLLEYEKDCLAKGYEGVMIRKPEGPYKCGRSTLREGYLLKLKRFTDSEAKVIGFEEMLHNTNEQETDKLGLSKRSSKKAGKVGAGILGKFLVVDIHSGVEFECGTGQGLTKELRKSIWDNRDEYLGKIIKYKHQSSGAQNKPRFPVWLGFRDERDM